MIDQNTTSSPERRTFSAVLRDEASDSNCNDCLWAKAKRKNLAELVAEGTLDTSVAIEKYSGFVEDCQSVRGADPAERRRLGTTACGEIIRRMQAVTEVTTNDERIGGVLLCAELGAEPLSDDAYAEMRQELVAMQQGRESDGQSQ